MPSVLNSPRASRGSGRRGRPMAEINVTPFVDVMLVLLIVFMVTAPLLTAGVPIDLPQTRARLLGQDREPLLLGREELAQARGAVTLDVACALGREQLGLHLARRLLRRIVVQNFLRRPCRQSAGEYLRLRFRSAAVERRARSAR